MKSKLLAGACALLLAGASPALASPPAPTTIVSNGAGPTGTSSAFTATGSCPAGSAAVAVAFNNYGRGVSTLTDNHSNTWTADTTQANGSSVTTVFYSTGLTNALAAGDTFTVTWSSSISSAPIFMAECLGTVTASDAAGKGGAGISTASTASWSTATTAPTSAARMFATLFISNAWSNVTNVMPGWTQFDSAMASAYFGIKFYYQDLAAGSAATVSATNTVSTVWQTSWHSFDYGTVTSSRASRIMMMGCC